MKSNKLIENTPAAASSATYRKVNNELAKVFNIEHDHTQYPKEDFANLIEQVDEKNKDRAIEWYRRGLKRGVICATDQIVAQTLTYKNDTLYAPSDVTISVKIKFKGEKWQKVDFVFNAEELGFK